MAYSWGLLGFSLVKVLAPGYFARQDTRTPVRVSLIAFSVNMILNVVIVLPAYWLGFPAPHVLLATSTSLAAAINTVLLWRGLKRDGIYRPEPGWPRLLAQIVAANGVMAAVLWWISGDLQAWAIARPLERVLRCGLCILAGAMVYFASLFTFGTRYRDLTSRPGRAAA
jgi:putative peptidoglycan lipid II flippase